MKLDLDRQETGRSDLAIRGTLKLGLPDGRPHEAQMAGTLVVQNLESRVLLNGSLQAEGLAECGSCLEEFTVRWDVPVEVMILRDVATDESEGETLLILQWRGEVDLHDSLRECTILAYPQAPLCKPDCKGLCPECGIDRNQATCDCGKGSLRQPDSWRKKKWPFPRKKRPSPARASAGPTGISPSRIPTSVHIAAHLVCLTGFVGSAAITASVKFSSWSPSSFFSSARRSA